MKVFFSKKFWNVAWQTKIANPQQNYVQNTLNTNIRKYFPPQEMNVISESSKVNWLIFDILLLKISSKSQLYRKWIKQIISSSTMQGYIIPLIMSYIINMIKISYYWRCVLIILYNIVSQQVLSQDNSMY